MATTLINGFHEDELGDWVAELSCGHSQHVRHRPPWQNRAWTQSEAGRAAQLGTRIECPLCRMPELPADVTEYRRTSTFTEHSIPSGLLASHRTKPGVWGKIVVESGRLEYCLEHPLVIFTLDAAQPGTIEPEVLHHVAALGSVSFHVEFWRRSTAPAAGQA